MADNSLSATQLIRECMAAAVRMAITRHNLELDPDAATEEEIAYDAAGACFGEECCDDKPIPELARLLAALSVESEEGTPPRQFLALRDFISEVRRFVQPIDCEEAS